MKYLYLYILLSAVIFLAPYFALANESAELPATFFSYYKKEDEKTIIHIIVKNSLPTSLNLIFTQADLSFLPCSSAKPPSSANSMSVYIGKSGIADIAIPIENAETAKLLSVCKYQINLKYMLGKDTNGLIQKKIVYSNQHGFPIDFFHKDHAISFLSLHAQSGFEDGVFLNLFLANNPGPNSIPPRASAQCITRQKKNVYFDLALDRDYSLGMPPKLARYKSTLKASDFFIEECSVDFRGETYSKVPIISASYQNGQCIEVTPK